MDAGTHVVNGFYLALLYLAIFGNYLGNLFGCKVQQLFRDNVLIKHTMGLVTTYTLIVLSTPPENYTAETTIGLTLAIYAWFFLTTKMHVYLWIPMMIAVMGACILWVYNKQRSTEEGEDKKKTEWMEPLQRVAVLFGGVLTAMGVVAYYGEKKMEYGNDFDAWKFWTAIPECRYATPPTSITTSMLAAFGLKA